MTDLELADLEAAPRLIGSNAIPAGRGRWRLTAYSRNFSSSALPTPIAELADARGRRLSRAWNAAAQLTFTLDGDSPAAAELLELATDVIAWRWDEAIGADRPMFRGILDHSEDQISEQAAIVTFTCHDYAAMLSRRLLPNPLSVVAVDSDSIATTLVTAALTESSTFGTSFAPGNFLPLSVRYMNPDGTARALGTGQLRDRTYPPQTVIGTAFDDLAKVINGFDYDVLPTGPAAAADLLRIFYPQQGVVRSDIALVYGVNVATLTRTVSSADYANYVRVLGNNGSADPAAAQLFAEAWNADANNVTVNPVGLWALGENAADVSVTSTLADKAGGDLGWFGLVTPSYTLGLRPGAYVYGAPNIGDTVPLYVNRGRLNVNTTVRVVGIDYAIGDDGQEDVTVTVGRPPATIAKRLSRADRDIDALTRR